MPACVRIWNDMCSDSCASNPVWPPAVGLATYSVHSGMLVVVGSPTIQSAMSCKPLEESDLRPAAAYSACLRSQYFSNPNDQQGRTNASYVGLRAQMEKRPNWLRAHALCHVYIKARLRHRRGDVHRQASWMQRRSKRSTYSNFDVGSGARSPASAGEVD